MNVAELLADLASGTNAIIRASASRLNLTTSQAFHLLSIPYDGISMSGLAHKLGLDNSTLTRNIQKLEKLDLVKRKNDNYDKRVQLAVLTSKGTSLLKSLELSLEQQITQVIEQIDLDTEVHLTTVLEELSWALGCMRVKP